MKKLKIIFNLITLALTTGLLVMITLAWYAVNKQASVEAGTGSVADLDNIVDTVEYYNFKTYDSDTNTYGVKSYVYTKFGDNGDRYQIDFIYDGDNLTGKSEELPITFSMNEYDYLSKDITKYLIKIKLLPGKSLSSLQFVSTASYFMGFSSTNTTGAIDDVSNLSMSSAIEFGFYASNQPEINAKNNYNNAEVVISTLPTMNHFEYGTGANEYSGAITESKKTVASNLTPANSEAQVEIYLLIDYNINAINALYSNNLQSHWTGGPQFKEKDFTIFILG